MFTFIETKLFTRLVRNYMADDEYAALQASLLAHPEAGVVIPGSRGIRKLRWRAAGKGKRGGFRVIYYLRRSQGAFLMLTMYPKSVRDDLPLHVLRQIRQEIKDD